MTIKHYIKSDGNGGVTINKNLITFLTFVMLVLMATIAFASRAGGAKRDIENLKISVDKNLEMYDKLDKTTSNLKIDMEANIAGTKVEITTIKDDISEIKSDIKLLLGKP